MFNLMKPVTSDDLIRSRRNALRMGVGGVLAGGLAGVARGAVGTTVTPTETQGPYWVDTLLNRSDIRTDSKGNAGTQAGLPLYLSVTVSKLANGVSSPVSGAQVDIWHCNGNGYYSAVSAGAGNPDTTAYNYLRGYQLTSARGLVNFTTIYPGWYTSRSVHIHCRIRTYSGTTTTYNNTTQFFFDDTVSTYVFATYAPYTTKGSTGRTYNSTDSVYNTVSTGSTTSAPDGSRLMLRLQRGATYATASFNVVIA